MKQTLIAIAAAALLVSGCASQPAEIVTATDKEVVVSISEKGAKELDKSLAAAGEIATRACGKNKMVAKFSRSENVAQGVVARFDCIAPPPKAETGMGPSQG